MDTAEDRHRGLYEELIKRGHFNTNTPHKKDPYVCITADQSGKKNGHSMILYSPNCRESYQKKPFHYNENKSKRPTFNKELVDELKLALDNVYDDKKRYDKEGQREIWRQWNVRDWDLFENILKKYIEQNEKGYENTKGGGTNIKPDFSPGKDMVLSGGAGKDDNQSLKPFVVSGQFQPLNPKDIKSRKFTPPMAPDSEDYGVEEAQKKDRADANHQKILIQLTEFLCKNNFSPSSNSNLDLVLEEKDGLCIIEVKSGTLQNYKRQLEKAVIQLLRYAFSLRKQGKTIKKAAIVIEGIDAPEYVEDFIGFCSTLNIALILFGEKWPWQNELLAWLHK